MDLFDLTGKAALVTGASRGLGRGMAEALARAGADVVLVGRSNADLEDTARAIEAAGRGRARPLPWDVSDIDALGELVQRSADAFGRLDVVVHGAGIQVRKPALDIEPADWDAIHLVHLKAAFFLATAAARRMRRQAEGGSIIFVASLTSVTGIPHTAPYSAAKSGILGLTRTLAVEWAPYRIRVNALAPGYFHTQLTDALFRDPDRRAALLSRIPMGEGGKPEDLAGAVVFLASRASSYVTGQTLFVDGGWTAGSELGGRRGGEGAGEATEEAAEQGAGAGVSGAAAGGGERR